MQHTLVYCFQKLIFSFYGVMCPKNGEMMMLLGGKQHPWAAYKSRW